MSKRELNWDEIEKINGSYCMKCGQFYEYQSDEWFQLVYKGFCYNCWDTAKSNFINTLMKTKLFKLMERFLTWLANKVG